MSEINPEVLKVFGFWGSILVLKMLAMVPLTGRQRFRKRCYINVISLIYTMCSLLPVFCSYLFATISYFAIPSRSMMFLVSSEVRQFLSWATENKKHRITRRNCEIRDSRKEVFANKEDLMFQDKVKAKVTYDDPDVERVRRAHLNDLENILPWFIITYLWLGTGPSAWLAKTLIRTFVLSRVAHTMSYAVYSQQPMRAITFFVAWGVMGFEAVKTLLYYS